MEQRRYWSTQRYHAQDCKTAGLTEIVAFSGTECDYFINLQNVCALSGTKPKTPLLLIMTRMHLERLHSFQDSSGSYDPFTRDHIRHTSSGMGPSSGRMFRVLQARIAYINGDSKIHASCCKFTVPTRTRFRPKRLLVNESAQCYDAISTRCKPEKFLLVGKYTPSSNVRVFGYVSSARCIGAVL